MLCDQITQITGVVHFGNCAGLSPAVLTYFTPKEFYTVVKWGEVSVLIYLYNIQSNVIYKKKMNKKNAHIY